MSSELLTPSWFEAVSGPALRVLAVGEGPTPELGDSVSRVALTHLVPSEQDTSAPAVRTSLQALSSVGPHPVAVARLLRITGSRGLQETLARVDVVWSTDRSTDRALAARPDVLRELPLLVSRDVPAAVTAHLALAEWLARSTGDDGTSDPAALGAIVATAPAGAGLAVVLTDAVRHIARRDVTTAGRVVDAASSAPWERDERVTSGLAAQITVRGLRTAEHPESLDDAELLLTVSRTLEAADTALDRGHASRALGLASDALAVAFHRERHSETLRSALVEDPAAFLAPVAGSAVLRLLGHRLARSGRPLDDAAPVLVLSSPYASFHGEVVAALESSGLDVETIDLAEHHPLFRRTVVDVEFLHALAHACRWPDRTGLGARTELRGTERRLLASVERVLAGRRAIFCDWLDRSTVWASHLCPPETRLVVRVHAVDVLSAWLPLVRWASVDEVIVVSPAMRSLVMDELTALGHDVPVRVVPSFGSVAGYARPKAEGARTTMGMIGWGRRVKDPLWALDLLGRDPSWRLVLVGPGPGEGTSASERAYFRELEARLAEPAVAERVRVLGWTDDVPEALREIGVVLSTSRREGCHRGLIEGAASGAVPVVRDWPLLAARHGPGGLVPAEWVVHDLDAAAARVRSVTQPDQWPAASEETAQVAARTFDGEAADAAYVEAVTGTGR